MCDVDMILVQLLEERGVEFRGPFVGFWWFGGWGRRGFRCGGGRFEGARLVLGFGRHCSLSYLEKLDVGVKLELDRRCSYLVYAVYRIESSKLSGDSTSHSLQPWTGQ